MEDYSMETGSSRVRQLRASPTDTRRQQRWRWQDAFAYIFPDAWQRVSHDPKVKGQELRLLIGLLQRVQWDNVCVGSLASAGTAAGLCRTAVYRAAVHLVAAEVVCLEPDPHAPRRYIVHLSPALVWRGRPWLRSVALRHYQALWSHYHGHLRAEARTVDEASHPPDGTRTAATTPYAHYPPRPPLRSL